MSRVPAIGNDGEKPIGFPVSEPRELKAMRMIKNPTKIRTAGQNAREAKAKTAWTGAQKGPNTIGASISAPIITRAAPMMIKKLLPADLPLRVSG